MGRGMVMKFYWLCCMKQLCLNFMEYHALTKSLQVLVSLSKDIKYRGESFLTCLNFSRIRVSPSRLFECSFLQQYRGNGACGRKYRNCRMEALLHINQETSDLALNIFYPQFVYLCYQAHNAAVITLIHLMQNGKILCPLKHNIKIAYTSVSWY